MKYRRWAETVSKPVMGVEESFHKTPVCLEWFSCKVTVFLIKQIKISLYGDAPSSSPRITQSMSFSASPIFHLRLHGRAPFRKAGLPDDKNVCQPELDLKWGMHGPS